MRRHPIPPFTRDTALAKVQAAEKAWNTQNAKTVAQTYSPDCVWRNREELFQGRAAIEYFLKRKWTVESHCRSTRELLAVTDNRISVRFEYEWQHAKSGQWYRSHGIEHWEFDTDGYMTICDMTDHCSSTLAVN